MTERVGARSISRPVRERLLRRPFPPIHVLAVFEGACDLVTADGDVVALVTPSIGNGPLNVVLDEESRGFPALEPGMPARLEGGRLRVGDLEIDVAGAEVWEPRPDWRVLRSRRAAIASQMPVLRSLCLERACADSLLALLGQDASRRAPAPRGSILAAAQSAIAALEAGWAGDMARLREGTARLAGLGNGLTPGGDDFLAGAMLWAWAAHPTPGSFGRAVAETAAPLTTTLSAAFLRAAARGECSAAWHALLKALAGGDVVAVAEATRSVLARGATSGADALAGFLWLSP